MNNQAFSFDDYAAITRPITFKLRGGQTLDASYFENYMTEPNLKRFDDEVETNEAGLLTDQMKAYAKHLSICLATINAGYTDKATGEYVKLDDSTEPAREEILLKLSYQDLAVMVSQIARDLGRPLDMEEKDSLDGQGAKAETAPAQKTETAT